MFTRLRKFVFGDDIFISYSRRDGSQYATRLANELGALGFTCRFERLATKAGREIPSSLLRAVRRSYLLVLIGTAEAQQSKAVHEEVTEFGKTSRLIIPIIFEGVRLGDYVCTNGIMEKVARDSGTARSQPGALWADEIHGLPTPCENPDSLRNHQPSPEVVSQISDACTFT